MTDLEDLQCACGRTRLEVTGTPILVSECLCNSCRLAAARLATRPGGRSPLTPYGATPCAEVRKDRGRIVAGLETLCEFRLTPTSGTRRVVATCCDSLVFLEMKGAHRLSLDLDLRPAATRPRPVLRTMAADIADRSSLPNDLPNLDRHSVRFYAKRFGAWVAMGFRKPRFVVQGRLDLPELLPDVRA
jgi:hypothetical protein